MIDTDHEKDFFKVILSVKVENSKKIENCIDKLLKLSETKKVVPSSLVKEFFDYLHDSSDLLEFLNKERKEKAQTVAQKAKTRLSKNGYLFTQFDNMIQSCVRRYFLTKKKPNKREMVRILFDEIKKFNPPYNTRKKSILIGFLLSEFSLIEASRNKLKNKEWVKKTLTLREYHDSSSYFVSQLEKKRA